MYRSTLPTPKKHTQTAYNEKEARDVIHTLLSALAYCHENRIVHRDLKARAISSFSSATPTRDR